MTPMHVLEREVAQDLIHAPVMKDTVVLIVPIQFVSVSQVLIPEFAMEEMEHVTKRTIVFVTMDGLD